LNVRVVSVRRVTDSSFRHDASTSASGEVRRILGATTLSKCIPAVDDQTHQENEQDQRDGKEGDHLASLWTAKPLEHFLLDLS
jgi:hypothetical protein